MKLFDKVMSVKAVVVFQKPRGAKGMVLVGCKNEMFISLKSRVSPASIYLHECLHVLYPRWSERKILATERRMWKSLTVHQRYLLYRKLFNRPFRRGYEE